MNHCVKCGKPLRRIHRSLLQQLHYSAIFECPGCGIQEYAPRPYQFHFGPNVLCPRCGTTKVKRRKQRDRIDPMHWSFLTLLETLIGGGKLFHCQFCRIQFYDRRNVSPQAAKVS